jgi:spore photoproduct lyase
VNIEYFLEYADRRIRELNPPQTIYKWDNQTDINCFEPEYDATRLMVEFFARQKKDFLLLYTGKSDNVDFLLNYDHKGQTIIQWSLGAKTQSLQIEKETAPWDKRVEAAAKCEQAGYHVRFRFSPIFPVKNWREEYKDLIKLIFAKTHPDVISLCMFGWMDYEKAYSCVDMSLLDERFVKAMEGTASFLKGKRYGPLPHEAREEIYDFLITELKRVSPETPIALCLDTREMWTRFRDRLGMGPEHYVCVCGPLCTPGNPMLHSRAAS